MNQDTATQLAVDALAVMMKVSMPFLLAGLLVGLVISVFQAATQIQEQSLVFVPKMAALMAVLLLCGGWMMTRLVDFTRGLITSLPDFVR